jgi:hypothetical protein
MPGTSRSLTVHNPASAHRASRRSARTDFRSERKIPSSKLGKWARKRDAAKGNRIRRRRQEEERNPERRRDFEARVPPRANGKSPMAERRTSVNRSPCGRRASPVLAQLVVRRLGDSILGPRLSFHGFSHSRIFQRENKEYKAKGTPPLPLFCGQGGTAEK